LSIGALPLAAAAACLIWLAIVMTGDPLLVAAFLMISGVSVVLFRAALQCDDSSLNAQHFPHIAVQSRYTARRTDFPPSLSQARSEQVLAGAPSVTLYSADGHLRPLEEIEADIIRLAIGHYRGRMTEVARRLGIGRSTLYRKLGDLGIDTAA